MHARRHTNIVKNAYTWTNMTMYKPLQTHTDVPYNTHQCCVSYTNTHSCETQVCIHVYIHTCMHLHSTHSCVYKDVSLMLKAHKGKTISLPRGSDKYHDHSSSCGCGGRFDKTDSVCGRVVWSEPLDECFIYPSRDFSLYTFYPYENHNGS